MGEPQRILVTGAAGFVGRRQVAILADRGHCVVAMARATPVSAAPGVIIRQGDVRDAASVLAAMEGCRAVIHLAAAKNDERFSRDVNVGGTANVIAACRRTGARRLIYVSTQADPRGTYGRTKYDGEALVRESGLLWTITKPNLIYGDDTNGAFAKVARAVTRLPLVPITGPGRAKFWPIHVDDHGLATARILESDATIGRTYVLAGPDGASLTDLVGMMARRLGRRPRTLHLPLWFSLMAARMCVRLRPDRPPISVSNVLGCNQEGVDHDITAMRRDLGVEPRPLSQGLDEVLGALSQTP